MNSAIKRFIKDLLFLIGLHYGTDYKVIKNHLYIRHLKNITGKITVALREAFPVYNFYWETPRRLTWF